ncbi:fibronectin type III domain-containing protein [Anaeromyxobacter paludicola]|uniref:Fibronectin type-III domain-containing protein n=1 Tax=Anaeromyxobacter paludicola TaxID=2918171 RepID=A0ABN6NA53_9BACT|nr:fibronectin type III domain-containing protein [Anaeromyxobacter paludicola]BDG08880.1 hypothetical protein AMPC_19930 [Anaeromyxobacter paludicola]
MVPRLAALLLLLPSVALGAVTISVSESADSDGYVNIAECQGSTDNLTAAWSGVTSTSTNLSLYVSDTSGCIDTGSSSTTVRGTAIDASASASGPSTNPVTTASNAASLAGLGGCNTYQPIYFCLFDGAPSSTTLVAQGSIQLDGLRPAAPDIQSVTPGNAALTVYWTAGTGSDGGTTGAAKSYEAHAVNASNTSEDHSQTVTSGTSVRIGGLQNDVTYNVYVYALSAGGNYSAASAAVQGSPIPVDDFWTSYKNAGGRDSGGCSSGAAGAVALLLSPLLLLARKRRRS